MSDLSSGVSVRRFEAEHASACEDVVAREEPLEIQLGGAPLAVVMAGLYVVILALGFLDFAILVGWWCARLFRRRSWPYAIPPTGRQSSSSW